jgi:hypothetical protein
MSVSPGPDRFPLLALALSVSRRRAGAARSAGPVSRSILSTRKKDFVFGILKALLRSGKGKRGQRPSLGSRLAVETLEDRLSPAMVMMLPGGVVSLNPQPLPPGEMPALVAHIPLVSVNPQPLPP